MGWILTILTKPDVYVFVYTYNFFFVSILSHRL